MNENNNNEAVIEIIREGGKKKREEFHYCKWAAQAWEAEFYAGTDIHQTSIDRTIKIMLNDVCWMTSISRSKIDTKAVQRRIASNKKPRRAKRDTEKE